MIRLFAALAVACIAWWCDPASAVIALDGTPKSGIISGAAASSIISASFTTTGTTDAIIACVGTTDDGDGTGPYTVSSIAATGLTFTKRSGQTATLAASPKIDVECWSATDTSTFTGTVTANLSGSAKGGIIMVFAFSGVNTTTPFDANGSLPAFNSNTTTTAGAVSATISTTNANTGLFAFIFNGTGSQTTWTNQSGFLAILTGISGFSGSPNFAQAYGQGEYDVVSSAQSSASVGFATNTASYLMVVDAVQAPGGGGATSPASFKTLLGVGK